MEPNKWLAPGRATMADLDDAAGNAAVQIADAVASVAAEATWKAAAGHYLGAGLEEGEPSSAPPKRRAVGSAPEEGWGRP